MTNTPHEEGLMAWREIAETLNISEAAVKRRYNTAIRKMRAELARQGITEEDFHRYLHMRIE